MNEKLKTNSKNVYQTESKFPQFACLIHKSMFDGNSVVPNKLQSGIAPVLDFDLTMRPDCCASADFSNFTLICCYKCGMIFLSFQFSW